jgi:apolipoprotein N-acyltransferase
VLPESTFPFPLNRYQYAQELLSPVCAEKYVLVGSHYGAEEGEGKFSLYNSAYVLRAGRILYRYDKKLLLPFFEEQPSPSFFFHRIHSPFLVGKSAFDSQKKSPTRYTVPGVGSFSFRICSELLWDIPLHEQVVLLVNDSHYRYAYFSRLFKLFAQFQAVEKQSTLVYCGWKQKGRFDHSL